MRGSETRPITGSVSGALAALVFLWCPPGLRSQPEPEWLDRAEAMAGAVTIARDGYGVPHISAPTDAGAVFGFVYARAEDEFAYMERSLITSLGRLSEVVGEEAFGWDRFVRALGVPETADREYAGLPADVRALCDAGADALNFFLHTHPEVEPALLTGFEPSWFLAQELGFNVYMGLQAAQAVEGLNPEDIPGIPTPIDGSNAWAIGPSRTQDGHAMLFINPHIPLPALYEGHLTSEDGWDFYGGTAYGRGLMPLFGHNRRLGWTLTVNYPDVADLYRVTFDNMTDPLAYRYGGGWRRATEAEVTIGVLQLDGSMEDRSVRIVRTHHGPVIGSGDGGHIAVRVAKIDEGGLLEQWYRMSRAEDLDGFMDAIRPRALCFHNIVYADADGNIFYLYNGAIPRRSDALDWSRPVDGSDPEAEWDGYYEIDELPSVLNPPCGYVQNCNSDPFVTSADGNPNRGDFPTPMVGSDPRNYRVKMSHAILGRDTPFTFENLSTIAFDTYVYAADEFVPRIEDAWRALLRGNDARGELLRGPVEALIGWDRRATVESVETTVFMLWFETALSAIWSGMLTDAQCVTALEQVIGSLKGSFDRWDVAWGDVNRHQRPGPDTTRPFSDERESLPTAGAHGSAGIVFTFLARSQGTRLRYGFHGHSFVGVVEFGESTRSGSVTPYGQSRDPTSAHYDDQMALYAAGQLKRPLLTERELAEGVVRVYHPGD